MGASRASPRPGHWVLARLALVAAAVTPVGAAAADAPAGPGAAPGGPGSPLRPFICKLEGTYTYEEYRDIQQLNCGKVRRAVANFQRASATQRVKEAQKRLWADFGRGATALCQQAGAFVAQNKSREAALYAVNAWGTEIMGGRQCCDMTWAPYCAETHWSTSTVALGTLLGVCLLMFAGTAVASLFVRVKRAEPGALEDDAGPLPYGTAMPPRRVCAQRMAAELQDAWLVSSCLRALPGASAFARCTATLFGALHERFDFQGDSVRNQFDHLLSLWRSHASLVADRSVAEGVRVEEGTLLVEALGDMHTELLEGFLLWRAKFAACEACQIQEQAATALPQIGGGRWGPLEAGLCGDESKALTLSRKLAEVAAYLLVWGEAGNVRFMPELLYFLTDLVLSADDPAQGAPLYGPGLPAASAGAAAVGGGGGGPFRSGLFLSRVIRPVYQVVFDEWYEKVSLEEGGRDKKHLLKDFDRYLPADAANYDDWNEFFCDPGRLARGLLLEDGSELFELPRGQRFAALSRVDWEVSLQRFEMKTHREVHSLWGVFAATHRVWLVHALLFVCGVVATARDGPRESGVALAGNRLAVRLAFAGLLVPLHGLLWAFARWQTTGTAIRSRPFSCRCFCRSLRTLLLLILPLPTYAAVRLMELWACDSHGHFMGSLVETVAAALGETKSESEYGTLMQGCLAAHYLASLAGFCFLLGSPAQEQDKLWPMTRVPCHIRAVRWFFWFYLLSVKSLLGLVIFQAVHTASRDLKMTAIGGERQEEVARAWFSTTYDAHLMEWLLLWFTTFFLFVADTQLWFTVGCTALGVAIVMVQRQCKVFTWALEDAMAKVPERFSQKVLPYSPPLVENGETCLDQRRMTFYFPLVWDRIIDYMRYEDKCDNQAMGDLSFDAGDAGRPVSWRQLDQVLRRQRRMRHAASGSASLTDFNTVAPTPEGTQDSLSMSSYTATSDRRTTGRQFVRVPDIFRTKNPLEICFKHYFCIPDPSWPSNLEAQWRFVALSRGLGLPIPRPFRVPYIPGLTVFIPHYGEQILVQKHELFTARGGEHEGRVELIDWVKARYEEEFRAFTSRMQAKSSNSWPTTGSQWAEYTDHQWDKICAWASMRLQTLYRTVAGMCLYHPVLQCHFEIQGDRTSRLSKPEVWDPSDCVTVLVAMQEYKNFDKVRLSHANRMFEKFPQSLKVAFIDWELKNVNADADGVHHRQRRRYFSCLADKSCRKDADGRRLPRWRVELPGYPILGDGKSDNQNHAGIFTRGVFAQCIDSNQGAYFEQMMLLPCVLGEFRTRFRGDPKAKRIIGLPEHITSDIGSIGDFAAGAEQAFGTIQQRSWALLGARMHYGHPDIMNKQYMMQQGGVSKGTKTLNLSEDIFAGMDFTLRGGGRQILHKEYFHLAKGRDLGFNTVLGFFSKLSMGAGEQILTRQMFRLGELLTLPECLTFYYAHVGYYLTQAFISWSMPVMVFTWLLILANDCEETFRAFEQCADSGAPRVVAEMLSVWFSWVLVLYLIATSLPLFCEMWMERSLRVALTRFVKMYVTCSWLMFIFQAKIIGYYFVNELRYGGAAYVGTGRGLPTDRRPFVGEPTLRGSKGAGARRIAKVGGLYLDYASHAYYDAMWLLLFTLMVPVMGGAGPASGGRLVLTWASLTVTIVSWLYAPFIFNPYQFSPADTAQDLRAWCGFFFDEGGQNWVEWYNKMQLHPRRGFRHTVIDTYFFLVLTGLTAWFSAINEKLSLLTLIYSMTDYTWLLQIVVLVPPVGAAWCFCALSVLVQSCLGISNRVAKAMRRQHRRHRHKREQAAMAPVAAVALRLEKPAESSEESDSASATDESTDEDAESEGGIAVRQRAEDYMLPDVETDSEREDDHQCCRTGLPLAYSCAAVLLLQIAEAVASLYVMYIYGWHKTFFAGLLLKLLLLEVFITLSEGVLKSRCSTSLSACVLPLDVWVHANRMGRDMVTSAFIFLTLLPWVGLNWLNEFMCPGCSAHQLLIYRDPGHLQRKEAVIIDLLGDSSEYQGGSESEAEQLLDEEEGGAVVRVDAGQPVPPPPEPARPAKALGPPQAGQPARAGASAARQSPRAL